VAKAVARHWTAEWASSHSVAGADHRLEHVRVSVPPVDEVRALGRECQHLFERLTNAATGDAPPLI